MADPGLRAVKFGIFARNVVLLTIAVVFFAYTGPYYFEYAAADILATAAFVLLLSWCLTPSLRLDNGRLDDTGNSFALRLGKATKRGLRRLKGLF
jgi:hypothetical protein